MKGWLAVLAVAVALLIGAQFITVMIIAPIGAVPEGRTVIITRLTNMKFIDSSDSICQRLQGGVSLLCRGVVLGQVLKESTILLKLPYSKFLYRISTDGKTYDR